MRHAGQTLTGKDHTPCAAEHSPASRLSHVAGWCLRPSSRVRGERRSPSNPSGPDSSLLVVTDAFPRAQNATVGEGRTNHNIERSKM